MTTTEGEMSLPGKTKGEVSLPVIVHFLGTLTVPLPGASPFAQTFTYGDELEVTDAITEEGRDRVGTTWVDFLDDEPGQLRRWGKVMVRRGRWPEGTSRREPGSIEWNDEREELRREAYTIANEDERYRRLSLINKTYGVPTTSTTVARYPSASDGPWHD